MEEKKAENKYEDGITRGHGVVIMKSHNNKKEMY